MIQMMTLVLVATFLVSANPASAQLDKMFKGLSGTIAALELLGRMAAGAPVGRGPAGGSSSSGRG